MLKWCLVFLLSITTYVCEDLFDFQLYHNLTAERLKGTTGQRKSFGGGRGLGRVLTWNLNKFEGCLGDDEAPQLKDAVCAVLRSADVIALQGTENMRISCLPCYKEFRDKYEWSGYGMPRGFKVMVKGAQDNGIVLEKVGRCSTGDDRNKDNDDGETGSRRGFGDSQHLYQHVMRALKDMEEDRQHHRDKEAERLKNSTPARGNLMESHAVDTTLKPGTPDSSTVDTILKPGTPDISTAVEVLQKSVGGEKFEKASGKSDFVMKNRTSVEEQRVNSSTLLRTGFTDTQPQQKSNSSTRNTSTNNNDSNNNKDNQDNNKNNNNEGESSDALRRFHGANATDNNLDKKVALTRFLLESEEANATARGNMSNVVKFTGGSDKQVARFLTTEVTTEANNEVETTEEALKRRLYNTREKLSKFKNVESKKERYKIIDRKLSTIEKEIDDMVAEDDSPTSSSAAGARSMSGEKDDVKAVQKDMIEKEAISTEEYPVHQQHTSKEINASSDVTTEKNTSMVSETLGKKLDSVKNENHIPASVSFETIATHPSKPSKATPVLSKDIGVKTAALTGAAAATGTAADNHLTQNTEHKDQNDQNDHMAHSHLNTNEQAHEVKPISANAADPTPPLVDPLSHNFKPLPVNEPVDDPIPSPAKLIEAEQVGQNPKPDVDADQPVLGPKISAINQPSPDLETLVNAGNEGVQEALPSADHNQAASVNPQLPPVLTQHQQAILGLKALVSSNEEVVPQQQSQEVLANTGNPQIEESTGVPRNSPSDSANFYHVDLQVTLGSKKSKVQRMKATAPATPTPTTKPTTTAAQRMQISAHARALSDKHPDKRVSLPVRNKKVVLYKSIIDSSGHLIFKRSIQWERKRRSLLSKLSLLKKNAVSEYYKPKGVIEDSPDANIFPLQVEASKGLKKDAVKEYYKLNGELNEDGDVPPDIHQNKRSNGETAKKILKRRKGELDETTEVEDYDKPQVVSELKEYLAELKKDVSELKRDVVTESEVKSGNDGGLGTDNTEDGGLENDIVKGSKLKSDTSVENELNSGTGIHKVLKSDISTEGQVKSDTGKDSEQEIDTGKDVVTKKSILQSYNKLKVGASKLNVSDSKAVNASKKSIIGDLLQQAKRDDDPTIDYAQQQTKEVHYAITQIDDMKSDDPLIVVNLRLPKEAAYHRKCFDDMLVDLVLVMKRANVRTNVFIMGDFQFDQMTAWDSTGAMSTTLTNLHLKHEDYQTVIKYDAKDPITTIYGRRFDNILTNMDLKRDLKVMGPDFPIPPKQDIIPFTLQRLYNNYMTSYYTTGSAAADVIYHCIKAYQIAGKRELDKDVCRDTWVPSSYISDHLPLQISVSFKVDNESDVQLKFGSWNIQGNTLKERFEDTAVKNMFIKSLEKYHLLIFHEFPSLDDVFDEDDQAMIAGNMVRLTQGDISTEFGIFIHQNVKDGETDMYALKKRLRTEEIKPTQDEDKMETISTVGLFIPKLVIRTHTIRPCLYTVKTSDKETPSFDRLTILLDAIHKDVEKRECDVKLLLASLNFDDSFDLPYEIYKKYKFKVMLCGVPEAYSAPKTHAPADYVIFIGGKGDTNNSNCTIGLPGDEKKRGIERLNDFQELSTHYPLSANIRN